VLDDSRADETAGHRRRGNPAKGPGRRVDSHVPVATQLRRGAHRVSEGRVLDALRLALGGCCRRSSILPGDCSICRSRATGASRSSWATRTTGSRPATSPFDGGTRCILTVVRDIPVDPRAVAAAAFAREQHPAAGLRLSLEVRGNLRAVVFDANASAMVGLMWHSWKTWAGACIRSISRRGFRSRWRESGRST
jgi:hypothetical protein